MPICYGSDDYFVVGTPLTYKFFWEDFICGAQLLF